MCSSDLLGFVKTQSDTNLGPRICVFSSYGSPTVTAEGFDYDRINGSPLAHLGVQQRVSIAVSVIEDSPSICLFYTRTEFEDAVRRLCTRVRKPLPLHKGAIDYGTKEKTEDGDEREEDRDLARYRGTRMDDSQTLNKWTNRCTKNPS